MTLMPALQNASAIPRPMPLVEPVTIAVFFTITQPPQVVTFRGDIVNIPQVTNLVRPARTKKGAGGDNQRPFPAEDLLQVVAGLGLILVRLGFRLLALI